MLGQAYLLGHNGAAATAEFQRRLNHRGCVLNFVTGALVHLQIGRAYATALAGACVTTHSNGSLPQLGGNDVTQPKMIPCEGSGPLVYGPDEPDGTVYCSKCGRSGLPMKTTSLNNIILFKRTS